MTESTDLTERLFDAGVNDGIVQNHCIVIDDDGLICYGGPIRTAPELAGKLILLNPVDFEKLQKIVERSRH